MSTINITTEKYMAIEATLADLSLKLERAACVVQDLSENYFGCITRDDLWKLEAGFHEHRIKTDIVFDYIANSQKLIDQAEKELTALR